MALAIITTTCFLVRASVGFELRGLSNATWRETHSERGPPCIVRSAQHLEIDDMHNSVDIACHLRLQLVTCVDHHTQLGRDHRLRWAPRKVNIDPRGRRHGLACHSFGHGRPAHVACGVRKQATVGQRRVPRQYHSSVSCCDSCEVCTSHNAATSQPASSSM